MEGRSDGWVHLNEEILLPRQVVIPGDDRIFHPGSKRLTNERVSNIDDPLAGNLVHIAVFWQVVGDLGILARSLEDSLDAEVLVLRTVEMLDFVAFDTTMEMKITKRTYKKRLPLTKSFKK